MYDPIKARDRAQATTISRATNAIQIDNGTVKGSVHTGPGGVVTIGSGSVGDENWVDVKKSGIQDGHVGDDANFSISDNTLPAGKVWLTPKPGKYRINGVNYKYVLDNSAAWKIPTLSA